MIAGEEFADCTCTRRIYRAVNGNWYHWECDGRPTPAHWNPDTIRPHLESLTRARICTHCGQSWDNPDHVCACNMGVRHRRLAAELARQHRDQCGPAPGDPYDADLWACEAAALLEQIAGTP